MNRPIELMRAPTTVVGAAGEVGESGRGLKLGILGKMTAIRQRWPSQYLGLVFCNV